VKQKAVFLPSKIILPIVSVMILLHVVMLAIYTQEATSRQTTVKRNLLVQQVMNTVHMVQATPPDHLEEAIQAVDTPHLDVELTALPEYNLHITDLTFWGIWHLIPHNSSNIKLSLHLPDHRWVNVHATTTSEILWAQMFLLFVEGLLAFIIFFYAWSINRFTQPLKEFRKAAERLGVDVHTTPLNVYKGPPVVRETTDAINRMQKRIQDLLHSRTQMLAAISHDLRTPITRLKLRTHSINDSGLQETISRDLDEMESMIAETLVYAKEESNAEKKIKLDLNSLLQTLCDDMVALGFDVEFESDSKRIPFQGRPLALKRALTNVIQNAVKYGGKAQVALSRRLHYIKIVIKDEGPGIPDTELEKVFEPFYRCDRSRSRDFAGAGLGLSITREIIHSHQGDIDLKNRKKKGLTVTIRFTLDHK